MDELERFLYDPALERCPDFSQARYQIQRSSLINDQQHLEIANEEQAVELLRNTWTTDNMERRGLYQQQVAQDEAVKRERREIEEEEVRQQQSEQRRREEKDRKDKEDKRQMLYEIPMGVGMGADLDVLLKYAQQLADRRKFFPYCYMLSSFCREAEEELLCSVHDFGYDITQAADGKISLQASSAAKPSPKAIADTELTWEQVLLGKPMFLSSLLGVWHKGNVEMFSRFYSRMETHPELRRSNGKKVMARYHAIARSKFYKEMEVGTPFDISVISETVLRECRDYIEDKEKEKAKAE
ncbi:hypothetical protein PQX77_007638 [Marasmius sp. AFHP31]|nr:hypothetical protein PQX77_007638 [Marasmius sp. AFHP31]